MISDNYHEFVVISKNWTISIIVKDDIMVNR